MCQGLSILYHLTNYRVTEILSFIPHAVPHLHKSSQNYHVIECPKSELGPAIISIHSNMKNPRSHPSRGHRGDGWGGVGGGGGGSVWLELVWGAYTHQVSSRSFETVGGQTQSSSRGYSFPAVYENTLKLDVSIWRIQLCNFPQLVDAHKHLRTLTRSKAQLETWSVCAVLLSLCGCLCG